MKTAISSSSSSMTCSLSGAPGSDQEATYPAIRVRLYASIPDAIASETRFRVP